MRVLVSRFLEKATDLDKRQPWVFWISLFGFFSIFSVTLRPVLGVQKYNADDEEKYSAD